ncbi:MAG TPA: TauD/TfdA family dioxygenase [Pyrinomonadaceae bacterium]|jgi:taurine dioxygenase
MRRAKFLHTPFEILPLNNFGAEVLDFDLSRPFAHEVSEHLRMALAKFQILIFRNQNISPADQTRITQCFGELEPGIVRRPENHQVPDHPNILYLSNENDSPTLDYGSAWHSDGLAYARIPHGMTMLYCIACPPGAGATLFANQYMAYEAMKESFQNILNDLFWYLPKIDYSEVPAGKGLAQPLMRIHPETGRKFIFCSPSACQIRGMTRLESAGILKVVHAYQVRNEFVYCHYWQKNEVVMWENCALLHNRADVVDFAAQGLRAMHRSATEGRFEAIECEAAEE